LVIHKSCTCIPKPSCLAFHYMRRTRWT
jgi:hypothetical protein